MLLNTTWNKDFTALSNAYADDVELDSIIAELHLWETCWNNQYRLPKTALETVQGIDMVLFPAITNMLNIVCTLPVNTCECKCSFQHSRG